jgi:hypothetical protein
LRELLEAIRELRLEDDSHLTRLENKLDRAEVVEPEDAPENLVTISWT